MAAKRNIAKLELYLDKALKWRWRLRRPNGKLVSTSGENFSNKTKARESWKNAEDGIKSKWTIVIEESADDVDNNEDEAL